MVLLKILCFSISWMLIIGPVKSFSQSILVHHPESELLDTMLFQAFKESKLIVTTYEIQGKRWQDTFRC